MNGVRAVIFDMDGVIFDSERATFLGWKELAEKYGFADLEIPYRQCIGVNAARSREIFLDFYGADFPYDRLCREQSENYHRKYDGGRLPLKLGVRELLEDLARRRLFVAIASSTRTVTVEAQIRDAGLAGYFQRIVGGDQVARSKPEPDIFLEALRGTDIAPGEAVVLEDSFNGIRAAARAGMIPVMVPDMLPPDREMEQLARVILPDLTEVPAFLDTLQEG